MRLYYRTASSLLQQICIGTTNFRLIYEDFRDIQGDSLLKLKSYTLTALEIFSNKGKAFRELFSFAFLAPPAPRLPKKQWPRTPVPLERVTSCRLLWVQVFPSPLFSHVVPQPFPWNWCKFHCSFHQKFQKFGTVLRIRIFGDFRSLYWPKPL